MNAIRSRLTYANVMATVAVFVVLGGGAYAIKLGKGSVGPKQLKAKAVKTAKIANAAVTGEKLADGSVGASKLASAAVTSAKIAPGSVSLEDTDPSLHQICPAATSYITGACIDQQPSTANNWGEAFVVCVDRGGRLPTAAELLLYRVQPGVTLQSPSEWAVDQSQIDPDDGTPGNLETRVAAVDEGGGGVQIVSSGAADRQYRCVFNPAG